MFDKGYEIRTVDCQLLLREGDEEGGRTIRGYAIVFNRESVVLDCCGEKFREVIAPEAVRESWLRTQDVKMNMLHDRTLTIARCNKGKGNMQMGVDDKGVWFEFEAPKCDIGDRCVAMVREEVFTGCSFEFRPKTWETKDREGKEPLIIHREFAMLGALTIGMDPAYMQTSVSVRELVEPAEAEEEPAEVRETEEEVIEEKTDDRSLEIERSEAMRRARERELDLSEY